jgi:hypothetical protein
MVHVRTRLVALAPALLLLVAACGQSKQAKLFAEIESLCDSAVASGWTLAQAEIELRGADVRSALPVCSATTGNLPPPNTDSCGTASAENPVCSVFFEWVASDSSLCNPGGGCCLLCEVRVKKTDLDAKGGNAPLCASRGAQGQFCQ